MRLQRDNDAAASIAVWISMGTKPLWSLVRGGIYWVASAAASAALRILPRYLPWLRCDALHPSAPDATRVARLNQCFLNHDMHRLRVRSGPGLRVLSQVRAAYRARRGAVGSEAFQARGH